MRKVNLFRNTVLAGLLACVFLWSIPAVVRAGSIQLQNGTATFSQSLDGILYSPDQAIDGNFDDLKGWAIASVDAFGGTTSEVAVWETATDLSTGTLVFTMHFLHANPGYLLGRFRFSVTTDDRSAFADGLRTGGDVDANWIVLTNPIVSGPVGMTFTTLSDHSVLAGGTTAAQGIYNVIYSTTISGITGVRLEALEHPSLPGGTGQACFPGTGTSSSTSCSSIGLSPQSSGQVLSSFRTVLPLSPSLSTGSFTAPAKQSTGTSGT